MEDEQQSPNPRRQFLRQAAAATIVGAAASFTLEHAAKADEAVPSAAHQKFHLPLDGELATIGGFILVDVKENRESRKVIVARVDANTLAACSATCTHQGCDVEYDGGAKQWACPCHGSRFSLDGQVVQGPAIDPLEQFTAALEVELGSAKGDISKSKFSESSVNDCK